MVVTRRQADIMNSDVRGQSTNASSSNGVPDGGNAHRPHPIAKAIITHKATNCLELSFNVGDEITELKEVGPNLWEGYHKPTRKKGVFNRDHVHFLLDTEERRQPSRGSSVRKSPERPQPAIPRQVAAKPKPERAPPNEVDFLQIPKTSGAIFALLAVMAVAASVAVWQSKVQTIKSGKFRVNITDMKIQFASQEPDMWDTLRAGLMSSRTEGVQTFLFLHNSPRTAVCFIKKLSDNSCATYRANDISTSESFVEEVKEKLLAHKCLNLYDLEDLHPDGVAFLKGFCDAYQPIVPDTQFFFAFNAGADLEAEAKKLARNLLESKWSKDLTHDEFSGTLTRLTQNVLKIRKEPDVPC